MSKEECRKKLVKNPQKVKDLRQAIIYTVNKTRSTLALYDVCIIADLLRRETDNKEYMTLTSLELEKAAIISRILKSDSDENIRILGCFITSLESVDRRRRERQT